MLILACALAFAAAQDATDLGLIVVNATRPEAPDARLTVSVNPDAPEQAVVVSAPTGIRCGAGAHEYSRHEAPRLCWLRRPKASTIALTAQAPAAWGDAWRVEWSGCEASDERACTVLIGQVDLSISARFVQTGR